MTPKPVGITDGARQLRQVVDASADWIVLATAQGEIVFSSQACERLLGYSPIDLVGSSAVDLVHPDDREAVHAAMAGPEGCGPLCMTYRVLRADGTLIWVESTAQPSASETGRLAIVTRDVTTRHLREARLLRAALLDPLTGLANRRKIREELHAAVARTERLGGGLAMLFLDIDDFKAVNDAHGHPVGDALLQAVAARIRENTREGDVSGRYGGDEFVVISSYRERECANAALNAARLRDALNAPYVLSGVVVTVSVTIGTAIWRAGLTAEDLLATADARMYAGKSGH